MFMGITSETLEIEETHRDHRGNLFSANLTNIKIPKEVANLLRIYCIFNNRKITEFVSELLTGELKEFKEKIDGMK